VQDFKKLRVWEQAHKLTLDIYKATAAFPNHENYGLTNQIRRAAASIPTNITEGCGRNSQAEFAHFLQIAMGSASEVEYQLILAHDLYYLNDDCFQTLSEQNILTKKMLNTLIQKLKTKA
jgi:four helix bundle protein